MSVMIIDIKYSDYTLLVNTVKDVIDTFYMTKHGRSVSVHYTCQSSMLVYRNILTCLIDMYNELILISPSYHNVFDYESWKYENELVVTSMKMRVHIAMWIGKVLDCDECNGKYNK